MALLLIDLDGTIREPLSGERYFQHPKDQAIIAGADRALQSYSDNWIVVGITNQGGVAAGHKSMQVCIEEQQYTLELFPRLKEIYFCPDFAGKKCFRVTPHNAHNHSKTQWSGQYRKPGAGMLLLAIARHQQSAQNTCYVGDRSEDETAAKRAKVQFQWAEDWIRQTINNWIYTCRKEDEVGFYRFYTVSHKMKPVPEIHQGDYMRAESRQKPPLEPAQGQGIPLPELLQQMEPDKSKLAK